MKNSFLVLVVIFMHNISFSQGYGIGSVVEYNKPLEVQLEVYDVPKRFNKVENQSEIDYSDIGGLLQSYLSANNTNWVKSEYLKPSQVSNIRDQEHFEAVKKSSLDDYAQLECVYNFKYNERQMAFVRYSFVFEEVPFPFVGILSCEKVNNRWYLSNLLNQGDVYYLLKDFSNSFIIECLNNISSSNEKIRVIENNSMNYNKKVSLSKLYKQLIKTQSADKSFFYSIRDQRMIIEETPFRNATFNSTSKKFTFSDINHPFVYDNVNFEEYSKKYKGIVSEEKSLKEFENKPELLLLSDTPIDLLLKVQVKEGNNNNFFIVYMKNNIKEVIQLVEKSKGSYEKSKSDSLSNFSSILKLVKPQFLIKVFNREVKSEISSLIYTNSGALNIDIFYDYILDDKSELKEYLDK